MKVLAEQYQRSFEPVKLTITLETLKDVEVMAEIFNYVPLMNYIEKAGGDRKGFNKISTALMECIGRNIYPRKIGEHFSNYFGKG